MPRILHYLVAMLLSFGFHIAKTACQAHRLSEDCEISLSLSPFVCLSDSRRSLKNRTGCTKKCAKRAEERGERGQKAEAHLGAGRRLSCESMAGELVGPVVDPVGRTMTDRQTRAL